MLKSFNTCTEKLYIYSCDWNYRSDHCMYGSTCKPAEKYGASILHGSRSSFHNDKQPAFKAVYDAIKDVSTRYCMLLTEYIIPS